MWLQGLTVFKRGTPSSRPTGGGVIEITIKVRLVQKAVEITKVVARMGEGPQFAARAGAKRASRRADLA